MRLFSIGALAFFCSAVSAQTPGAGDIRPVPPSSEPSEQKEKLPKPATDSDRALARCQALAAEQRDECLRKERERSAASGAERASEPATAPPPQNPR